VEKSKDMPGDKLDDAVLSNVQLVVEQLKKSRPIPAEMAAQGKIKIVGARYDLDTGVVTWLQ
jgi:carbonic anhydrase